MYPVLPVSAVLFVKYEAGSTPDFFLMEAKYERSHINAVSLPC